MNTIRQAILKAADHIEAHPELFDFSEIHIPECGTPGCMVGWVGHFMGERSKKPCWMDDCTPIMGVDSDVFLHRIRQWKGLWFTSNANDAATALRRYADKYHPEQESYPEISKELDRIFSDTRGATV